MGLMDSIARFLSLEPFQEVQERVEFDPYSPLAVQLQALQAKPRPWRLPSIDEALGVPAIQRAVTLIANTTGSLAIEAYRNGVKLIDTPRVVSRPDPFHTPRDFYSSAAYCMASARRDGAGGSPRATGSGTPRPWSSCRSTSCSSRRTRATGSVPGTRGSTRSAPATRPRTRPATSSTSPTSSARSPSAGWARSRWPAPPPRSRWSRRNGPPTSTPRAAIRPSSSTRRSRWRKRRPTRSAASGSRPPRTCRR